MGRAILIDNFLPSDAFDKLTERVVKSKYWDSNTLGDYVRDDLWEDVTTSVFGVCQYINLYSERFPHDKKNYNFSYNQFRPANYHHNGNQGAHIDNYWRIHPDWDENWGGKIAVTKCSES